MAELDGKAIAKALGELIAERDALKAEAEAARPLLEAVMNGEVYRNDETGEVTFYTGDGIVLVEKAALALRSRIEAEKEK